MKLKESLKESLCNKELEVSLNLSRTFNWHAVFC